MRMRISLFFVALAAAAPLMAAAPDAAHAETAAQLHHAKVMRQARAQARAEHRQAREIASHMRAWNAIATCESGGNWHINTGNGYYGGLQMAASTWYGYGGGKYASLPSRASKHDQLLVAERILRGQGWGAWPACSARAGLR